MGKQQEKKPKQEKQQLQITDKDNAQIPHEGISIQDIARAKGKSVKKVMEQPANSDNVDEIYELLRQQFPDLKKWMESRFPGDSYQKALNLRHEKFGKIQQSFSEVHRLEKLLKMGKSVCKVIVPNVSQGTGFVLFDRLILTSAHLFKECVQEKKLLDHITVSALFNYNEPEPETNYFWFDAEKRLVDIDDELDYAVLELSPEGHTYVPNTKPENIKVPPGLLNRFGPLPGNGEACLIGHPAGNVKKIDPTCIIEPEKREQAVKDHLAPYETTMFTIQSITVIIQSQDIEKIMGGRIADKVGTYNTFMYHGASGSPVFDAHCRVFGLHTSGFTYGFPRHQESVIEYAHSLLVIFKKFVENLKTTSGMESVVDGVLVEAQGNSELEKILKSVELNLNRDPAHCVENQEENESLIQSPDQKETKKIPPGLLEKFGPVPQPGDDGGACIIGHPAGGVKKMHVTCVIRKEDREQAVNQNLEPYKDYIFTVCSMNNQIKRDPCADIHVTDNTFMYHGSSGSPVFDASGRVFGLHSGGFFFEEAIPGHSVIEFAYPLLDIFKKLLEELQKNGSWDFLDRVLKVAQGIKCLDEIIKSWRGVNFDFELPKVDLSQCGNLYRGDARAFPHSPDFILKPY
ncbi:uncharacterized protein FYW61_019012 [Anableps anableps]